MTKGTKIALYTVGGLVVATGLFFGIRAIIRKSQKKNTKDREELEQLRRIDNYGFDLLDPSTWGNKFVNLSDKIEKVHEDRTECLEAEALTGMKQSEMRQKIFAGDVTWFVQLNKVAKDKVVKCPEISKMLEKI